MSNPKLETFNQVRDVVADGYGLEDGSADAVLLMNILHCEDGKLALFGNWVFGYDTGV